MGGMAQSIYNPDLSNPVKDNLVFQLDDGGYELHLLSGKILILLTQNDDWGTLYGRIDGLIWTMARHNGLDLSGLRFMSVNHEGQEWGELDVTIGQNMFKVNIKKDAMHLTAADYSLAVTELRRQVIQFQSVNDLTGTELEWQTNATITNLNWLGDWLKTCMPKIRPIRLYNSYWRDWESDIVKTHELMTRYYDM